MTDLKKEEQPAPTGRVLAGDFGSPLDVLAADELSETEKREVLMTWRRDLDRQDALDEHSELVATIDEALQRLD